MFYLTLVRGNCHVYYVPGYIYKWLVIRYSDQGTRLEAYSSLKESLYAVKFWQTYDEIKQEERAVYGLK